MARKTVLGVMILYLISGSEDPVPRVLQLMSGKYSDSRVTARFGQDGLPITSHFGSVPPRIGEGP